MTDLIPQPGAFHFAVLNDLHYMEDACRPWLEGLIREINAIPGLELVLVLGDLSEIGTRHELESAKSILERLRVPWYTVPGNHDGPENRPVGSSPELMTEYNRLFPGRRNYFFTHKHWQFLGLDTTNGSGYKQLPLPTEARAFATHAAATLDPALPTILFTHMPLNPTIKYALADGYDLLALLSPLNLRIVFSGHFHGLTQTCAPDYPHIPLLTNRCCSRTRELHDDSTQRGYYRCRANADESVTHEFMEWRG